MHDNGSFIRSSSALDNECCEDHSSLNFMNPLYATTQQGTIGELIVQLRFLEHDVQAAPPIKDSGNDLIAIRERVFRAVQVRSTINETIHIPDDRVLYDILAVVQLPKKNGRFVTRDAQIYLFPVDTVKAGLPGKVSRYPKNLFSQELIDALFTNPNQ